MEKMWDIKLKGIFFFNRLKKGDSGYYKRLNERYQYIKKSAVKYRSMTDQELFSSYIELMDIVLQMHNEDSTENGSQR